MNALTGIPIEALFGLIGGLGLLVYGHIMYELRALRKESGERGKGLTVLQTYMRLVCNKLGIPYNDD